MSKDTIVQGRVSKNYKPEELRAAAQQYADILRGIVYNGKDGLT